MSNNTLAPEATAATVGYAAPSASPAAPRAEGFAIHIVGAIAFAHLLNDTIQGIVSASYPLLKVQFSLTFTEIGWIALLYQLTAACLQPWIGLYTDKHPKPYLLPMGMAVTLLGIGMLAIAGSFSMIMLSTALIGVGSATFHPEASRMARMASGGRYGTAQSMFQVGGNAGAALGPLMAAAIIMPFGQRAIAWFVILPAVAIWVLLRVTRWRLLNAPSFAATSGKQSESFLDKNQIVRALVVIAILMLAKFVYIAAFTNYFTFYLMERFQVSAQTSQLYLFVFLGAVAAGTFAGGPIGDRIGRKAVIWISFLGVAPFALLLPHANLFWTAMLTVMIGLVMSSAFAALVVYAQEALPGRVGLISGLMFGLMFGIGGIGAAGLGRLADLHGIVWVYSVCAYLPLLGLATALLPSAKRRRP
jgi:FSR family fosmidomycin resistance protein-like MFS transporter